MKIAAIDPGLTGAAVVLEQIGGAVMLISAIDLPIMGDGAKRRLDAARPSDDVCLLSNKFGPLGLQRNRQRGAGHRISG